MSYTRIYFDTETTGLDPHTDVIKLAQIKCDDGPVQLFQNPDYTQLRALLDSAETVVGHNLHFDFSMLDYIPKNFEDTMLLSRIHDYGAESHSLDAVLERKLGYNPYKNKKALQKSNWSGELTQDQRDYAAADVQYLSTLLELYDTDNATYRFDKRSVVAGLIAQRPGLPVLRDKVQEELEATRATLADLLENLWFNPNSSQQTMRVLGLGSSSDQVLARELASGNNLAGAVRKARKARKHINFLEKLVGSPRYYGTLKPMAKSGRFTSSQNNIQQIPRSQKKFIGVEPGRVLISSDYAQLEMRTAAIVAQDRALLDLFKSGADLHDYTARALFGDEFTKPQRQIAKVFNFASLYGSGAATIQDILIAKTGIILPLHEVKDYRSRWLATFNGVKRWQERGARRHESAGEWHTPAGRRYKSQRFTDMLNIENQGFGAEIARIALHKLLDTLPPGAQVINFIHDAVLVEADESCAVEAADAVVAAMCHGWSAHPTDKLGLDMPVAAGVALDWYTADTENEELCIHVSKGTAL